MRDALGRVGERPRSGAPGRFSGRPLRGAGEVAPTSKPARDGPFEALERRVVDHLFELQPGYAVFLGLHRYDGRLPDYAPLATERWLAEADRLRTELRGTATDREIDRSLLELLLESPTFDLREDEVLERNPMAYIGSVSMTSYLIREYAPPEARVEAILATLRGVPALLEHGRRRLRDRLPAPFIQLAESIGSGLPSHFDELEEFVRRRAPSMAPQVGDAVRPARAAVDAFVERLRAHWAPKSTPEFALGPTRYQRLLWVREGIDTPFSEILAEGRRDLERNKARLAEIARGVGGAGPLLERLYADHPSAARLVPEAQAFVAESRAFVAGHRLVTIPEPDLCRVEETPSYGRALSTASMNPPGPFDTQGDEGIYFVTPVDPSWSPERQEEWLRSLNRAMLRNITFHEVYPGHYLQFLHHRRASASLARKVSISNAFTEGWAHYCEQLAVESGLGAGGPEAEAAQLHDALLRDCRLIASIGLHTGGMSLEAATRLFETEARFERLPAEREAIRGTFNPEYYCYTLGKLAILRARDRHLASRFGGSLERFHDALLSFGSPPVGLIDRLLAPPGR